jgi:hypothetical protein
VSFLLLSVIHSVTLTRSIVRRIRHFRFLVAGFSIVSHLFDISDNSSFHFVEVNCERGNLIVFGVCEWLSCLLVVS